MLYCQRKTSTTFAFVCLLHDPVDALYRNNVSVGISNTRLRESSPVMHVHTGYLQDKSHSFFLPGIQPD